jgi:nucleoside-diphosphate-sugar epimerase
MRTYFITGGEGFIGYHICRLLSEREEQVEIVTYDAQKHYVPLEDSDWPYYIDYRLNSLDNENVERIRGDTTDRGLLKSSLEKHKPDVIIHLAALPIANVSNKYPKEARTNILDGTITILDVLREVNFNFDRFVYTSSSMVYGDFPTDENGEILPASETDDCTPVGIYGSMKLSGENITRAYAHRFDLPYTIIRPSAVYGPTDCNRRVTEIFVTNAIEDKPLRLDNGGHHQLDFSYIEDTASGFLLAADQESGLNETFNITRGKGRSVRELAKVVSENISGTEMYSEEREVYRPNRGALDISKAREKLGYEPAYSLEDGIEEYLEFIRSEGPYQ